MRIDSLLNGLFVSLCAIKYTYCQAISSLTQIQALISANGIYIAYFQTCTYRDSTVVAYSLLIIETKSCAETKLFFPRDSLTD